MKKRNNKLMIASTALAAAATIVMPFGSVFAASAPTWSVTTGSSFTIVRNIQNAYGKVVNNFGYTISASSSNPAGATGAPTSATVAFNENITTQGTSTKTTNVSFASMQFERVGDYEFAIRETSSTNASTYPIDNTNYTAVVSVRNNDTLTGFVASLYVKDSNGDKVDTISGASSDVVFASGPAYTNIQISATASGNAADPDKCFDYTLTLTGLTDSYKVTTSSTCGNPSTVGNGGTIKLKANDSITIGLNGTLSQIPVGTQYTITKADTGDGYTTKMDNVQRTSITKTMVGTADSTYNTANKTTIDENLNSTVDTNAFMNITIYILLALAGAGGIYYVVKKKSHKEA